MPITEELEKFIQDLEREAYQVEAGLKNEANFSEIFTKADALISMDTVNELRESSIEDSERAEYLAFLLGMIVDKNLKELTDRVITMELDMTVGVEGKEIPFRQLMVEISNEPSHEKRSALDAARRKGQEELNRISRDIMEKTHHTVRGFDFESYVDFFEKVEGISLSDVRAEAGKLLDSTRGFYEDELTYYSETFLRVPPDEVAHYDLTYMRRANLFDEHFPADRLLPSVWETTGGMGIQAEDHPHIRLDVEKRPNKSPRAFCCPVRVPEEVYLVIMPHGGLEDYTSFLHELGHTLHYAHAKSTLSVAARHLGDNSVTEAFAGILEHLVYNIDWLGKRLSFTDTAEYMRYMEFFELYMLRRYCGKLQYEMELHGGTRTLDECPGLYSEILSAATLVKYDPAYYLQDVDSHFYCVRYLRSWMFERQVRAHLEKNFGSAWFESAEAGEFLLQLWSQGQKFKADTLSTVLGYGSLNFDEIIADYSR